MLVIVGAIVVLAGVIGGYLMESGNLSVLIQPAELVIIFGAAIGSFLVSSPPRVVKLVLREVVKVLSAKSTNKQAYLDLLSLLNLILTKIRKDGLISIEADIEDPKKSTLFNKYESVMKNHHALEFLSDNLKVIITANMPPHELDNLIDVDIEARHGEEMVASSSVATVGDALPGLGIVAAVLGVVITMGKISEPPDVLGHSIGAALVGTFLGILMCYGFVGPMAQNMAHHADERAVYLQVIKTVLVAFVGGSAPQMAVEAGRRAIPGAQRPSFSELEEGIRR